MIKTYMIDMTFASRRSARFVGHLRGPVRGRPAIARQIEANRAWLAAKGHRETGLVVTDKSDGSVVEGYA